MREASKRWTLVAVCVATFMLLLDITVVNVALPSIRDELDASFTDLQWVVDAYALTLAAFVLTSGSLADRLGRRRVFVVGLVIFTLASALCALSGDPTMLNISRAIQGVGGAIMFAVSLALLAQEFTGRERATATAIYGATIGVAVASGPLVGGALTDSLGWEWIFWLNVPIGIAGIAITLGKVRESRDPNARGIDWLGLVTFSIANTLLVYALIRGNALGWGSWQITGSLIGSATAFIAFVAVQLRIRNPMLPLGYFRNRSFTGAQIAAFGVSASMFALFLYITLYVQNILGHSALETALIYLPSTVVTLIFSGVAAAAMTRIPFRALLGIGLVVVGGGLLLLGGREIGDEWSALIAGFVVTGIGVGLINPVIANLALSTVPDEHSGIASGINDTFRQVGIATGIAAFGAIFLDRAADYLVEALPATNPQLANGIAEASASGALPADTPAAIVAVAQRAFLEGYNEILVIGAAVAMAGGILAALLVRGSDVREPEPAE